MEFVSMSSMSNSLRHLRRLFLLAVLCGTLSHMLLAQQGKRPLAGTITEAPSPGPSIAGVTAPDHIVIVIEENHSFSSIIGSSSAPFINSLAQQGALFTQSFATNHPSQPNYLALFSGSAQGLTSDSCPHTFSGANLGSELTGAGLTFKGFSENLPSAGSTVCTSGAYARKHNPWVDFTNIATSANQPFTAFPTDFTTLPTISIVVPNLNDDMHDGTISQGDTWLQQHLSTYLQFAQTHNSLLIVTWDEDDNSSSNQIPTIFIGPMVKPGQFSEKINHFNILRTLEDLYTLPRAGSSATATPITDVWKQAAPQADFSISASPASLSIQQGRSGNSTISVAALSGFNSAVALSASGAPAGVTAMFSPVSLAAPGSGNSTLTLAVSGAAATGTFNITVTATGAGITHTTVVPLTVTSGVVQNPDFSLSVSPAALTVAQGSSGTSALSILVSNGFSSTVTFSASGAPAGVTSAFSPASLAPPGSGSSTLSLSVGSAVPAGTYSITITASGGGISHTASLALTVTADGGGTTTDLIGNGGFEKGSSNASPWTTTPSVINNINNQSPHTGAWYAWLDGYGTTHTDTITQSVTIPSAATAVSLSFWLHIDTAETSTTTAFDTLTVEIHNSAGTLISTVATFSNLNAASGYQQHTFDLSSLAGQAVQLVMRGVEDHVQQTSFVVDDVSLTVTQ